jgi:hypothetical protein
MNIKNYGKPVDEFEIEAGILAIRKDKSVEREMLAEHY